MDCIFCKIVAGEIPSAKVFEDEHVLAFLDVNPDSQGHTLVIPKKHAENIFDINQESLRQVITVGQSIAQKLKAALAADGINVMQANGAAAGQVVAHFHLHLIPRFNNDGLKLHGQKPESSEKPSFMQLQALADKIAL